MNEVNAKIDANCLVLEGVQPSDIMVIVGELMSSQFTAVADSDKTFRLTLPINDVISRRYRAQIHVARSENLLTKDRSKGYTTDPDDKPPTPTNPRGSGGKVVEFQNTMAIAA